MTLEIKAVAGAYKGVLNGDRTEMTGTLTHGSVTLPLTFRKR